MNEQGYRRLTGLAFILGAVLINIPYTLLIASFDYPDILRAPTAEVLTRFQAGGTPLILTWLAFAWVGLPMLLGVTLLPRALDADDSPLLRTATALGVVGMVVQIVGLLRWVFVVPVLAQQYADPASGEATHAAVLVAFTAVHQYGGVVIGEHLGYAFSTMWMALVSVALLRAGRFPRWFGALGIVAAGVYSLAHAELFATVIPGFPVWAEAGLVGSLLWLGWMALLGVFLLCGGIERAPVTGAATLSAS
jgi:hypothetical protein